MFRLYFVTTASLLDYTLFYSQLKTIKRQTVLSMEMIEHDGIHNDVLSKDLNVNSVRVLLCVPSCALDSTISSSVFLNVHKVTKQNMGWGNWGRRR